MSMTNVFGKKFLVDFQVDMFHFISCFQQALFKIKDQETSGAQ